MKIKSAGFIFGLCLLSISVVGQTKKAVNPKIEKLLSSMTIEEKVSLCSGGDAGFRGIKRLNIQSLGLSDGPRGPHVGTAFPVGVLFGATWNPWLVECAGKVMGEELRSLGCSVLLGPGINIQRDPLGGRFFEYYTEDPFLNAAISVGQIKGIQSEGVAACAKHYACNNREDNRNFYMSVVDDRTLNEIYLPAFKAAVQQADLLTVMTSANGLNYEFVSDSRKMLTDILKNKWGFNGFVMTDWLQTRSVEKAAFAGLDVSMPGGDNCGFGSALLKAVKDGKVAESVIDDKVRHILYVYDKVGALDGRDIRKGATINTKEHVAIAREIAEDGIVLLKNDKNALPLKANKVKNILVTGPSADKRFCVIGLGGSSWVDSSDEVTILRGLQNKLGNAKVTYISSDDLGGFRLIPQEVMKPINGVRGFNAAYFVKGKEKPVISRVEKNVDFMWEMKSPDESIKVEDFSGAHFDTEIMPPVDGKYTFRFTVGGGSIWVYNNEWAGAPVAVADNGKGLNTVTASIDLKKGVPFHMCVVYNKASGDAAARIEWETPQSGASKAQLAKIDKAARKADAIVYVGGIDHSLDTEGRDKASLTFPMAQESLISHLSKVNKNLDLVLINGSPLEMGSVLPKVRSVIEAWYPGMEGGIAVANILFGQTNPSGRLPFTWPKKLADCPSQKLGYQDNDVILYKEGVMEGYRYYDTENVVPEFPFGYGLSYTNYEYSDLQVKKVGENEVSGNVTVTNSGKMDGNEVVQIYVKPVNPSIERPVHELKFFKKVFVKAGQSVKVDFDLKQDAFSYYDVHRGDWTVDKCNYEIEVGRNSQSIVLHSPISLN